MFIFLIDFYSL